MSMRISESVNKRSYRTSLLAGATIVTALLTLIAPACSNGGDAPGMAGSYDPSHKDGGTNTSGGQTSRTADSEVAGDSGTASGTCTIGDAVACRVVLGIYKGQESCFVGMQYCDTGTWTTCIDKRDAS